MTVRLDWHTVPKSLQAKIKRARGSFGLDVPVVERKGRFAVSSREDRTVDGKVMDSKKEAVRFAELQLLERLGEIEALEPHPSWRVEINGQHFCTYTADATYICKKRGLVIEDTKSSGTQKDAAYRLRKKAAELAHNIKVTEVIR